jgi:hypothetical protein
MRLLVVKMELYEMSPPPGNSGGAVSGEAPWPWADEPQSNKTNVIKTHLYVRHNLFKKRTFPPEARFVWIHESSEVANRQEVRLDSEW